MEDCEILNTRKRNDLPKQVALKKTKVPVSRVIVNGVEQTQYGEGLSLVCQSCGKTLFSFPYGVNELDAYDALVQSNGSLRKIAKYCPECGQKLSYEFGERIEM